MSRTILSKRIEQIRTNNGLNQIEFAKKIGLSSSSSISQYESGDRVPSDEIKLKICEVFKCSMDYLMGLTDEPSATLQKSVDINIGLSKEEYNALSDNAKKQIRDFAEFVKNQDKK